MALTAAQFDLILGYGVAATEERYVIKTEAFKVDQGITDKDDFFHQLQEVLGADSPTKTTYDKLDGADEVILLIGDKAVYDAAFAALILATDVYIPA